MYMRFSLCCLFNVYCIMCYHDLFCVSVHDTMHRLYNSIYLSLRKSYFNDERLVWYGIILTLYQLMKWKFSPVKPTMLLPKFWQPQLPFFKDIRLHE